MSVSLREKKVVLPATAKSAQQAFYFLPHNMVNVDGDRSRLYQRQRRGIKISWMDMAPAEPSVVIGELHDRLEEAYRLLDEAKKDTSLRKKGRP